MTDRPVVAYFSMEIGLEPSMPTYAGGLGILAGDTIRSAADLEVPMVAVTLLHRHGYFYQRLDGEGQQREEPVAWTVEDFLELLKPRVTVEIEGRPVQIRAWQYQMKGVSGFDVPVFLLDTAVPENSASDRKLTNDLYGGDRTYRLCQEAVLGLGGVKMLRALGYEQIVRFHLNEGHAALLVPALLAERSTVGASGTQHAPLESVRDQCVFTTHTPVPAGHDQFPVDLARMVLGDALWDLLKRCGQETGLNMTDLALRGSRYINGVAMKHGEVSQSLFPGYPIHSITNGVHPVTWAAPSFQALYDRHLPDWRKDQLSLRYAISIPSAEIWDAHMAAKRMLVDAVNHEANAGFDWKVMTIGFARRATAYKRGTLLFHDLERLKSIADKVGTFQVVFAGKAHPNDQAGKDMIRDIYRMREGLRDRIAVAYLTNYDMALAKLLCAGVDVWLNTPLPPMEASGTSGMKAAMNGVPSLSILDGWWVEGHIEGVTGWSIGDRIDACLDPGSGMDGCHADALYGRLADTVLPCFYQDHDRFVDIMRHTIALNGAFFNTQRMVEQYVHNAYRMNGPYVRQGS
ncbi:MAG TPA: alpha-glucan family phosphorylase [Nitrospiraceae bacterium]|nr:alpha-glucan family phosphorylase [Nitrospiraceae bacterium]